MARLLPIGDYGTVVTLTATAITGSSFTGWTGACTGVSDCVVTMGEAKTATATFTLGTNALTVLTDGTGTGAVTGSPSICGVDCSTVFDYGTMVTLTPFLTQIQLSQVGAAVCVM